MGAFRSLMFMLLFCVSSAHAILVTENAQFRLYYATTVGYVTMDGTTHASLNLQAGVYRCGNDLFGGDPAYGKVKACSYPDQIAGQCPVGYVWDEPSLTCIPPSSPDNVCSSLGDLGSSSSKWLYKGDTIGTCRGGCLFIGESVGYDKASGYSIVWGKLYNQGVSCTETTDTPQPYPADSPDKPSDAPHAGEKGFCPGQVNGVTVWVKCSSTTDNTSSKVSDSTTNTSSSGGAGTTSSSSTGGTSSTKCDGSNCTTTSKQTVINPDGSKTEKETTSTVPQSDYCKSNPLSAACKSSSWSGDCASGFSGDGDAVQVANRASQHIQPPPGGLRVEHLGVAFEPRHQPVITPLLQPSQPRVIVDLTNRPRRMMRNLVGCPPDRPPRVHQPPVSVVERLDPAARNCRSGKERSSRSSEWFDVATGVAQRLPDEGRGTAFPTEVGEWGFQGHRRSSSSICSPHVVQYQPGYCSHPYGGTRLPGSNSTTSWAHVVGSVSAL